MPSVRNVLAPSSRLLRCVAVASALACSAVVSGALPGAVAAADELAGTAVVGELVQVWAEGEHEDAAGAADAAEGPLSFVETAAGDAVRVPTEDVEDLPAGATVSVTVGAEVDDEAADEHGVEAARTVLASNLLAAPDEPAAPARSRAGLTNEVTVVLVAPAGAPQDGTRLADVVESVDGPVTDFWAEQSNGAISLGVTAAHDWMTTTAGCADPTKLWDEAAAAVRFVPGAGKHLLLYVTDAAPDCAFALAEVGSAPATGGRLYVRDTGTSLIAHELGHNFGLGHSSGQQCDAAVEAGNCRTAAYRDLYDVMGVSWEQFGSLNAAQAARLGVLPAAQQQTVAAGGSPVTVTLSPLSAASGTRALRLTDADGVDYWLEYRTATGQDAWLDGAANEFGLQSGVLLHRAGGLPDTSVLIDGSPSAALDWDSDLQAALPLGVAVPVSGGDFSVQVQSVSMAGADVVVTPVAVPGQGVPVPAPEGVTPGGLMSAAGRPVGAGDGGAVPEVAAVVPAPEFDGRLRAPAMPALESAADTTGGSGVLLPVVAVVLAGAVLLGVRATRRPRARVR